MKRYALAFAAALVIGGCAGPAEGYKTPSRYHTGSENTGRPESMGEMERDPNLRFENWPKTFRRESDPRYSHIEPEPLREKK